MRRIESEIVGQASTVTRSIDVHVIVSWVIARLFPSYSVMDDVRQLDAEFAAEMAALTQIYLQRRRSLLRIMPGRTPEYEIFPWDFNVRRLGAYAYRKYNKGETHDVHT